MQVHEFRKQLVLNELGITEEFGKVLAFIDFGNINYWFEDDRQNFDNSALQEGEKLGINLEKLKEFLDLFCDDSRFYYGHDPARPGSLKFIQKAQSVFNSTRVFTKSMQKIKHYLQTQDEINLNTRDLHHDRKGDYVILPKCNFDVEISVDALKTIEHYDSICLLSSDADFVHLLRYVKQKGKKVILIKGGHVVSGLKEIANIAVNAQDIKKYITDIKQIPG